MTQQQGSSRRLAALETCKTLLCPGKKWHLSPYIEYALREACVPELASLVPVYQSGLLDLLRDGHLAGDLCLLDLGSANGVAALAALDALLAWQTACTLYDIPSGIGRIDLELSDGGGPRSQRLWSSFCEALRSRDEEVSALPFVSAIADSAAGRQRPLGQAPTLVLAPLPWERATEVETLLDAMPDGGIVVATDWQAAESDMSLFAWRREMIQSRRDIVSLGPCGQEYGLDLPEACTTCFHGRREVVHFSTGDKAVAAWTYAIVARHDAVQPDTSAAAVSRADLAQTVTGDVRLRYVGSLREKVVVGDHPDAASDNPNDEEWREYLKICPGHTGAQRLAIERRAGMQTPRFRYGQWLNVTDLQPRQPYPHHPEIYVLRPRNEAAFQHASFPPIHTTFVEDYTPSVRSAVDEVAYRLFGFPEMYQFQHAVLERVLCGRDIFAIAATGGGKSECYILPAMVLPGITVVVSPLNSLIRDQYEDRMRARYGLDQLCTYINGEVPFYERQGRLRRMVLGHYKLIYVTPEQLERGYVLDALRQADATVGFRYLAMDEAHCISQWGHDFRPSYLNIVQRLRDYGLSPTRVALTATASPLVRDDVCQELHLDPKPLNNGGDVFIDSSNRPELNLVVRQTRNTEEKARIIVDALRRLGKDDSAIVFMPHTGGPPESPRDLGAPASDPAPANAGMVSSGVTPFARFLERALGQKVAMYHGALEDEPGSAGEAADPDGNGSNAHTITRQREQSQFMRDEKRIMVATKGFGMGIDKQNIRLVIHRSPPANLEAYIQEAGRSGRDGKLSTVMLLFSEERPRIVDVLPDVYVGRTSLPSDTEIQEYFIENRYVRREDVTAMLAFLRSQYPRRVGDGLYFTCDQVMAFFQSECSAEWHRHGLSEPYAWPSFPPRRTGGRYESGDHKRILDRGHIYSRRKRHIARILAVLFNNRPTVDGQLLPVVRSAHETGTLLRSMRLYKPDKIVESSAYFGQRLRRGGVSASELRRLLAPDRDTHLTDITPFAKRLRLTLRETASMLKDIRYCEGRTKMNGHWLGTLLDFWWIEAPRWVDSLKAGNPYTDLRLWRGYAGAYTRSRPRNNDSSVDAYFPWNVVNRPTGWEVIPGRGLDFSDSKKYLDAFMTLHNERRRNDVSNFEYLLSRYIGEDGSEHECLRALMLGYLKTNEVVVGGRCYGCSACVPDLRFDRYSLEERKRAVVRLDPTTVELVEQLEDANRSTPSLDTLVRILKAIEAEESRGRSGKAYLDSWLARLIQDDPEHVGALWLRLHALGQGTIDLSALDLLSAFERLVRLTVERSALSRLQELLESYCSESAHPSLQLGLTVQAALVAGKLREWDVEAEHWQRVVDLSASVEERNALHAALRHLLELYDRSDRLADATGAAEIGVRLARLPEATPEDVTAGYNAAVVSWTWARLREELSANTPRSARALLCYVTDASTRRHTRVTSWLEENRSLWTRWPREVLEAIQTQMGDIWDTSPRLLIAMSELAQDDQDYSLAARYTLRAWHAGAELSSRQLEDLAANLARLDPEWRQESLTGMRATELMDRLWQLDAEQSAKLAWSQHFSPSVIRAVSDDLIGRISAALLESKTSLGGGMRRAVIERFARLPDHKLKPLLASLVAKRPELSLDFLRASVGLKRVTADRIEAALPTALRGSDRERITGELLTQLSAEERHLEGESCGAACLDNWRALQSDSSTWPLLHERRIESDILVDIAKKWLRYRDKPHRMDMLVVILQDVKERSSPRWLTPASLELQALCAAGRFSEARKVIEEHTDLRIRGVEASEYLESARRRTSARESAHEPEFRRLWDLISTSCDNHTP